MPHLNCIRSLGSYDSATSNTRTVCSSSVRRSRASAPFPSISQSPALLGPRVISRRQSVLNGDRRPGEMSLRHLVWTTLNLLLSLHLPWDPCHFRVLSVWLTQHICSVLSRRWVFGLSRLAGWSKEQDTYVTLCPGVPQPPPCLNVWATAVLVQWVWPKNA